MVIVMVVPVVVVVVVVMVIMVVFFSVGGHCDYGNRCGMYVVYIKRLRIVLRCAKAGCGRGIGSS